MNDFIKNLIEKFSGNSETREALTSSIREAATYSFIFVIMHLQMSWKKFSAMKQKEQNV